MRNTARGYAVPDEPALVGSAGADTTMDGVPPVSPAQSKDHIVQDTIRSVPPDAPQAGAERPDPPVNIEVVRVAGPPPVSDPLRRTLEVWTLNHVYVTDSNLICIEVRDPATGQILADHAFLGTRLVGGQRHDQHNFELSCPFPRRGSSAVFESRKDKQRRFNYTSTVDRVVILLHVVTVPRDRVEPTWEEIAQAVE